MDNFCSCCKKTIEDAQEIEQGACFECLSEDIGLQQEDMMKPLDFDADPYYGVRDVELPQEDQDDVIAEIEADEGC